MEKADQKRLALLDGDHLDQAGVSVAGGFLDALIGICNSSHKFLMIQLEKLATGAVANPLTKLTERPTSCSSHFLARAVEFLYQKRYQIYKMNYNSIV